MQSQNIYKFDKFGILLSLIVMTAIIPVMSIDEIVRNGYIDMDALSPGRRRIHSWVLYLIGWATFFYFLIIFIIPALMAIYRGYVFKKDGDSLIINGKIIEKRSIKSYKRTIFRGIRLKTHTEVIYFHHGLNSEGVKELDKFLQEVPRE